MVATKLKMTKPTASASRAPRLQHDAEQTASLAKPKQNWTQEPLTCFAADAVCIHAVAGNWTFSRVSCWRRLIPATFRELCRHAEKGSDIREVAWRESSPHLSMETTPSYLTKPGRESTPCRRQGRLGRSTPLPVSSVRWSLQLE
jgi:hypothetical protein